MKANFLISEEPVRLIYVDEAGTSLREPVSVVVGVVINADLQVFDLQKYLKELADEYVPERDNARFVFHATDIVSGKKEFDRKIYPIKRRWELFEKLLNIPRLFRLPLAIGYIHRAKYKERVDRDAKGDHIGAFSLCVASADRWISIFCPNEISKVVAEDVIEMRGSLQEILLDLRHRSAIHVPVLDEITPISTIVDNIHFEKKHNAPLLQIADTCAYSIRRYLSGDSYGRRYLDVLTGGHYINYERLFAGVGGWYVFDWKEVAAGISFVSSKSSSDVNLEELKTRRL